MHLTSGIKSSKFLAKSRSGRRIKAWYILLILIIGLFVGRLFYLQIIKHDYYRQAALASQLKQSVIPAERGTIGAMDGASVVPLVLNQRLYTIYADPSFTSKGAEVEAQKVASILGGKTKDIQALMSVKDSRYQILANRVSERQKNQLVALKLPGIGVQARDYRVYPQGSLAAQLLGFVDDGGQGRYGIEQTLDSKLSGVPGMLKAITDTSGVPLAASPDNIQIDPKPGSSVVMTIDLAIQRGVESILKQGLLKVGSKSGSAIVIDPNSGMIKALANYPSYSPATFYKESDLSLFLNPAISTAFEVGSVMKSLTVSAALNQGVITPDSSYHDSGRVTIDGSTIKNVLPITTPTVSIKDILQKSLNTGAVHMLSELGGGTINQKGRNIWHDYMVNHFQLGVATGVEQTGEVSGTIPDPNHGYALNLQYANTAFGQGMTATVLQMAAAFSSAVNGGTYYKPYLVDEISSPSGDTIKTSPKIVKKDVVSSKVSAQVRGLLQYVFNRNHEIYYSKLHPGYNIGGKTGTSQIAKPGGGYLDGIYNGTFLGFVGGDMPQYVVVVQVNRPNLSDYESAGAQAAAPIFGHIADMLINDFNVKPKSR